MSKIEWTEETWNPIVGCSLVSPGCTNCYAMQQAARIERMNPGLEHYQSLTKPSKAGPVWTGKIGTAPDEVLTKPLRRKRPRMIFVNSMSDLFHESVPDEVIDRVFAVMALCPQHTFQVLTKRSARMREYMALRSLPDEKGNAADDIRVNITAWAATPSWREKHPTVAAMVPMGKFCAKIAWPLPNVWLGVSVEDQTRADERIPHLLATPAAVRWISAEPLLKHVELRWLPHREGDPAEDDLGGVIDALNGQVWIDSGVKYFPPVTMNRNGPYVVGLNKIADWPKIDWVIAGGESGKGARVWLGFDDAARSLREQCKSAGVPFFMKQMQGVRKSEMPPIPDDLMIREYPYAAAMGAEP
jgi:protein gp37